MIAIISAGGTGGHITPAIAIAKQLIKNKINIIFVGNKNSIEEELIKKYPKIKFFSINTQKIYRKFTLKHIFLPFKFFYSLLKSIYIIKKNKVDFFIGTGGYVSAPVGIAAKICKINIYLHEQNSYPGLVNKVLKIFAKTIFLGNTDAQKFFPISKTIVVGNPLKDNIILEKEKIAYEKYKLEKGKAIIALIGGSQGSTILNKNFYPIIDELLDNNFQIIWQVGKKDFPYYHKLLNKKKGLYLFDFSFEIGKIYNSISLAIARCGALSLAELEVKKIPSILIPLKSAAENHQYYNALNWVKEKKAEMLLQDEINPKILLNLVMKMHTNIDNYKTNFSKHSIHEKATLNIVENILKKEKNNVI